jgi:hypothetical protein
LKVNKVRIFNKVKLMYSTVNNIDL